MNFIKTTLLAVVLMVSTSIGAQESQSVSIIFTEGQDQSIVNTTCGASAEDLDALLAANNLDRSNVHIIRLYDLNADNQKGERKEIIMIQTEDVEDTDTEPRRVEFISVNGEQKRKEDLTEEERAILEQNNPRSRSNDDQRHEVDIRVEETIENGETQKKVWINGREASEEEAEKIMHGEMIELDGDQSQMVFIDENNVDQKHREVRIERREEVNTMNSEIKAIVIIKPSKDVQPQAKNDASAATFKITPNPTNGDAKLKLGHVLNGPYSLQVIDLQGRVVLEEDGNVKGASQLALDLSGLPAGAYVVSLSTADHMQSKKIVLE